MSEEPIAETPAEETPRVFGRRRMTGTPFIESRDFRGAPRPSPSDQRELEGLAGRVGKRLERSIANYLRQVVRTETLAPEVFEYQEAARAFSDGDWLLPLLADGGDRAVLRLDESFQNVLLTRVLGGGKPVAPEGQAEPDQEDFFEYESALSLEIGVVSRAAMKPLVRAILREWNLLLRDGAAPYALDAGREALPPARQLRAGDAVVAFESEVYLGAEHGRVQLLLQAASLAPMLAASTERPMPIPLDPAQKRGVETVVRDLDLEVSVVLGGASIEVKEYVKLSVGDVMVLDRRVGEPLRVRAGETMEFTAQPGRVGNKLAVRILERKDRETTP